ncbi:hypothetical protein AVEN_250089-1 [Araneus ventricosus]|uniref:Uncharacterized protein n=1 Tax=Araneus ventricosus TaxID=182803 RepID=A0A4Y2VFA7_ARAVE|nr:hypothetical protein AVEN_250089-1 [Araneus ventricosus]
MLWFLIVFIGLIFFYWWNRPVRHLRPWHPIPQRPPVLEKTSFLCQTSRDCSVYQVCFQGKCIDKMIRGGQCDERTGQWILIDQGRFVTCVCKHPHLVTQKFSGANCDVDVACGPHGHLENFDTFRCLCDFGYKDVNGQCVEALPDEMVHDGPCEADEIEHPLADHGFHSNYIDAVGTKKCVKRPCSFDVLTGRPLQNTVYVQHYGCVCDPSRGQFGVRIENYLTAPGHTACASIFKDPVPQNTTVRLYAMFWKFDRPPVSFIQFDDLDPNALVSPFDERVGKTGLQIGQKWPYDYMQYVFKKLDYTVHTRSCSAGVFTYDCNENETRERQMSHCRDISKSVDLELYPYVNAYALLYKFPVCYMTKEDERVPEIYRDTFVSNPLHMTFKNFPKLFRSNLLIMSIKNGTWHVSHADSPNLHLYRKSLFHHLVPDLHDRKVNSIEQNERTFPVPDQIPLFPDVLYKNNVLPVMTHDGRFIPGMLRPP